MILLIGDGHALTKVLTLEVIWLHDLVDEGKRNVFGNGLEVFIFNFQRLPLFLQMLFENLI